MRRSSLLLALVLAGCFPDLSLPDGAVVTCASDADCGGTGLACINGRCRKPGDADTTPPALAQFALSPAIAGQGTAVTVTLKADEPLAKPPEVSLALLTPQPVPCVAVAAEPNTYGCALVADRAMTGGRDGAVALRVVLTDVERNSKQYVPEQLLRIDVTPPALTPPDRVEPAVAKLGTAVRVTFSASEPLAAAPTLVATPSLAGASGPQAEWSTTKEGSGEAYVFEHTVSANDPQGQVRFEVAMTDRVGNSVRVPLTGTLTVDGDVPSVSDVSVTPPFAGPTSTVTATFTLSEAVPTLAVTLGGTPMKPDRRAGDAPLFFRYTLPVSGSGQGAKAVVLSATDAAGNAITETLGTVTFDFDPPSISSSSPSPALALPGDTVFYTLNPSEPLGAAPTLTLKTATGGATTLVATAVPGSTYLSSVPIPAGTADGSYDVFVAMSDRAGNPNAANEKGSPLRVDGTAPVMALVPPAATVFSAQPGRSAVSLAVDVKEALDGSACPSGCAFTGAVEGQAPMTCTASASPAAGFVRRYSCATTVTASDFHGPHNVVFTAQDAAGNLASLVTSVTFDLRPPALVARSEQVAIAAPAGSPVATTSAARDGSVVTYSFVTDEPVVQAPVVVATHSTDPTATLAFTNAMPISTGNVFQFTATLPAGAKEGQWSFTLSGLADAMDNVGTRAGTVPFVVDRTPPNAPSNAPGKLTLERRPWGSGTSATPSLVVRGSAGTAPANTTVLFFPSQAAGLVIGTTKSGTDGSIAALPLLSGDLGTVWAATMDEAANLSATVDAKDVEWTATLNGKRAFDRTTNPHLFEERPSFYPWLYERSQLREKGDDFAIAADGASLTTTFAASLRATPEAVLPPPQDGLEALVFDPARGKVVRPQGCASQASCEEWEWDLGWQKRPVADVEHDGNPDQRTYAMAAFDPASGRVLMYGGSHDLSGDSTGCDGATYTTNVGAPCDTTWAWDGVSWARVATAGANPGPRAHGAMATDFGRRKVVLFGGYSYAPDGTSTVSGDTWEYDGATWTLVTPADPEADGNPPAQVDSALVYDEARGKLVLLNGGEGTFGSPTTDLWEYDGVSWTKKPQATGPSRRRDAAIAYDAVRQRLVLFGGYDFTKSCSGGLYSSCNDVWEHDGTSWTKKSPALPLPDHRNNASAVFDRNLGRTLFLQGAPAFNSTFCDSKPLVSSGMNSKVCDTAYLWDGVKFFATPLVNPGSFPVGAAALNPVPRYVSETALASNPAGKVFLYGGAPCTDATCTNPVTTYEQYVWEWDGYSWARAPIWDAESDGSPSGRSYASAAWDPTRSSFLVAFGQATWSTPYGCDGQTATNFCAQMWEWTTQRSFKKVVPTDPEGDGDPGVRVRARLVHDAKRDVFVLLGGRLDTFNAPGCSGAYCPEVWEWNRTSWVKKTPTDPEGDGSPVPFDGAAAWYDPVAQRVTMFGGCNGTTKACNGDVWQWDGASWKKVAATDPEGDGNPKGLYEPGAAYDATRGALVLNGGVDWSNPVVQNERTIWEWNGTSWRQLGNVDVENDGAPAITGARAVYSAVWKTIALQDNQRTWLLTDHARPGQVFSVDWSSAGATAATVSGVDVTWWAGGSSTSAGATLWGFDGLGWTPLATHGSATAQLMSASVTNAQTLTRLFVGFPGPLLRFAVTSNADAYDGAVVTDAVQATVRYRR